ncbi:MAG TPA: pyridoxamine 5'-phosphate oxidase family protein [Acidobacteriaceae bacterium]|jgi:uncharacterized protein|nr:pyridoxamine 5'-phosphate oxidase family protein [Acidobacteriaceae bacterium]
MGHRFAELAFTPNVKAQQTRHGSRSQYERVEAGGSAGDRLRLPEQEFIRARDGFYMASTSESGWPYIQYRGGVPGFLLVLDDRTVGFADLRGNRQYISAGNLLHDDRVALFLMDYAAQARLKILGHAEIVEDTPAAREWLDRLRVPGEKTPAERAILIHVEGWDWNCHQHITPRYTEAEIASLLEPFRRRLAAYEEENARLRALTGEQAQPK